MQIAAVTLGFTSPDVVKSTVSSIEKWATDKILVVVDGAYWDLFSDFHCNDAIIIRGESHGTYPNVYKNVAIGLKTCYEIWPNADWYNWLEWDAAYLNDGFLSDLRKDAAVLGFHRQGSGANNNWLAKDILSKPDLESFKFLGAVLFYSNYAMQGLVKYNFFNEVLERTKMYHNGHLPNFHDYTVEEVLFPSAAAAFGSAVNLDGPRYAVRWHPQIRRDEITDETSIVHPTKTMCPIRLSQKTKKQNVINKKHILL